jgi:predicted TIM-barrel fold metal-dependent hydrolase
VLGTDYPYAMSDPDALGTLARAGLDAATVEGITSGNAKRFLKLKR